MRDEAGKQREHIASLEGRESVLTDMLRVSQEEYANMKEKLQQLTIVLTVFIYLQLSYPFFLLILNVSGIG